MDAVRPALLAAPLLLALVLALSGALKVRDQSSTVSAFRELRLPEGLLRAGGPRLLPWAELVLALGLLLAPEPLDLPVTVAAALLAAAYLLLVVRALGFEEPVTCGCFGRLGLGPLTGWSAVRNAVLLAVSLVAVLDAVAGDGAWWSRVDGTAPGWLAAVVVAALLGGLVAHRGEQSYEAPGLTPEEDGEEYERMGIPLLEMRVGDGGDVVTLHHLVRERPALLVSASLTCGTCLEALALLPRFEAENPEVAAYAVLTRSDVDQRLDQVPPGVSVLVDEPHLFAQAFGFGVPNAVLLGADQMVAGGPVRGLPPVEAFLEEIAGSLEDMRTSPEAPAGS